MNGEVLEGFLCPICLKDLGTITQLQNHFEEAHKSEDVAVIQHLKGLFEKAKKKFLNEEIVKDNLQTPINLSPKRIVNEKPQEIGRITSHTTFFKNLREKRIDAYALETNKLLLRLDKLIDDKAPMEPSKRKNYEKSVVPWTKDKKLTNPSFEPEGEMLGFRRSNSSGSLNSLFSSEGESHLRTCQRCSHLLERRHDQMETRNSTPMENFLYSRLCQYKMDAERQIPQVLTMAQSLRDGDETYSLQSAESERQKLIMIFDSIDKTSKRIATMIDEQNAGQKTMQLRRAIRQAAATWLQDNMLGLQSLPTREELDEIQRRKNLELEKRIAIEKDAMTKKLEKDNASKKVEIVVRKASLPNTKNMQDENGWKPETQVSDNDDPMLQQINIIKSYIKQAKQQCKWDEVHMLEENLNQLEKAYWDEKTKPFI
ncbi:DgyrCDS2701 [Dimorphilus gyrociliatus]|uniref:DgyrCDS2701 n=1 Tax=Dimorphilus gyrociliatus TaxID=2664684 RepID=A0A7I8VG73_9ANNE|nr:DgyrCDS2701 [Dimorphilus gyrociliatus]